MSDWLGGSGVSQRTFGERLIAEALRRFKLMGGNDPRVSLAPPMDQSVILANRQFAERPASASSAGSNAMDANAVLSAQAFGRVRFADTADRARTVTQAAQPAITSATESGTFGIGSDTAAANVLFQANGAAGTFRGLVVATAGLFRWFFGANNITEGSDAGSNAVLNAYDDAGSIIDTPAEVERKAGGLITLRRPILATDNLTVGLKFSCNGQPAQPSVVLGDMATDLPTALTLVNNIRLALINDGIGA